MQERVTEQKLLLTKKNTKAHRAFARKHFDDFWENILGTDLKT